MRTAEILVACAVLLCSSLCAQSDDDALRVFIFAGQSNMVGSDSKVRDIERFPPFSGLGEPQKKVLFSYCIGRENKRKSDGWVELAPVNDVVGPELSFAREVTGAIDAKIAIIKVAAGGTHLGGDWNPDEPKGFEMYPLALEWVRSALADLDRRKKRHRIEAFMWHQGENDMFDAGYMENYGKNLARFLACWRRDLGVPKLRFFVGELCTKTIWGMDLRPRMYAISVGQREVADADPFAEYVPTSHVGVEIGRPVGLHYHYGTLGQLEHGVNYADAYLRSVGVDRDNPRPLSKWPYRDGAKVRLFVLAGHRNMEGERAFVQDIRKGKHKALRKDDVTVAYRYDVAGGCKVSDGWEPLGPAGPYDTFGPELSFAKRLKKSGESDFAIAKFTHSGSQIIDWTPAGSVAKSRNLYPRFLEFVRTSVEQLESRGHEVEVAGVFYHLGENDMSWVPFRKQAIERLVSVIAKLREDLEMPALPWFVSQQPPTDHEGVNRVDVTADLVRAANGDPHLHHVRVFDLPGRDQELVITTEGIVELGVRLAKRYDASK